jgi:hypothetical protein
MNRVMIALLVFISFHNAASSQAPQHVVSVGSSVYVELTGLPAEEFIGLLGIPSPKELFCAPIVCKVEKIFHDNRVLLKGQRFDVDYAARREKSIDNQVLLTVTVIAKMDDMIRPEFDKPVEMFRLPIKPIFDKLIKEDQTEDRRFLTRLRRENMEGITLQSWALVQTVTEK